MVTYLNAAFLLVVATSVGGRLFGKEEMSFTTEDFVTKYGYPVETHTVTTEDGYLLTVHRIPGSPKAASSGVKTPVLVQHGLGAASDCWVLSGPERGLGFILADEGYDVWMSNARGNTYSRKHASLKPLDFSYSNYTWHEMGVYDLPAVIDHILETTNQRQLFYIGHSMGGAMFFVLTTMKPEYNQKIRLAVTLAPAVYIWKPKSMLSSAVQVSHSLFMGTLAADMGLPSLKGGSSMTGMIHTTCSEGQPFQRFCIDFYQATVGPNEKELNTTLLPSIITHGVSGYTPKILDHFSQLIKTERFQLYSQDSSKLSTQSEYDLSKVSAPVSIHYGVNDYLVPPEGMIHLSQRLPNLVKLVRVPDDNANHLDVVFAIHVKDLVYDQVLDLMKKF